MTHRESSLSQSGTIGFIPNEVRQSPGDIFTNQIIPKNPGTILVCDSDEWFFKVTSDLGREKGISLYQCQDQKQLKQTLVWTSPHSVWLAGDSLEIEQLLQLCVTKIGAETALVLLLNPGQEVTIKFPLPAKTPLSVIEKPRRSEKIKSLLDRTFVFPQQRRDAEQYLTLHYETINRLLPQEREVLLAICDGVLNKQMAKQLNVSIRTIEQKRQRLFRQLGVSSAGPLGFRAGLAEAFRKMTRH